jgi:hypothetical protein
MTLQNFGQALVLVAACACKCRGGMTLQKSAFRRRHEAANWQTDLRIPAIAITRFGASRSRVSRHRDHVVRRIAIGAKRPVML